jgi:hypothetical protein
MAQLVGKTFRGSTFVQDPIPEFIKIDGVVLGESTQYGYKVMNNARVTPILQACLADQNAVAIVYNWKTGVAYIKTGINFNIASDSKLNKEYTTFLISSRVSTLTLVAPINNNFLQISGGNLVLNGKPFVAVGMNAFFLGLMQETMSYPTKVQITEVFEAAKNMKATVIRSHTLGFSAQSLVALLDANNNINNAAWAPIDWAYAEAQRCGIKLIIVLCDPYEYYHGSFKTFCTPYGVAKDQFFTNSTARDAFKKYISTYLNHVNQYTKVAIKDCTAVACLELGNELGNIRPDAGSNVIPTKAWISDISTYIKSLTKILVLNGSDECLGSATSKDFEVSTIDIYSSHFYWDDKNRLLRDSQSSANNGKPYIIGEYSSRFTSDWLKSIEAMPNVKGSLVWSIYPHNNGLVTGTRLTHDDGFTFWYDNQSAENTKILLTLTNHFRRMQSLPVVTTLF